MIRGVSKANPCPVCQGDHKCSLTEDGLIFCGRMTGDTDTHKCFGPSRKDSQWSVYRVRNTQWNRKMTATKPRAKKPDTDWAAWAKRRAYPPGANSLDVALNLPAGTTQCLPLVGSDRDAGGGFWSVPMVNGHEKVVGVSRRYDDGSKKSLGSNGLFVPAGWRERPGPVFVVEGASDTAAMWAAGLCAVGRPSNTGGVGMLLALLPSNDGKPVVVVGENDPKESGDWPGLSGAVDVANQLRAGMRTRAVSWSVPPAAFKDAREYLTSFDASVPWAERGRALADWLTENAVPAGPPDVTLARVVVDLKRSLATMADAVCELQRRMA